MATGSVSAVLARAGGSAGLTLLSLSLSSCCLEVPNDLGRSTAGLGAGSSSSGRSTNTGASGGGSSGGSSSGGSWTGGSLCAGVSCAAFYTCDPADGICKCGGQLCDTGNCDPTSGACLEGCLEGDAGSLTFVGTDTPLNDAQQLPLASLGRSYAVTLQVACVGGPVNFTFTDAGGTLPTGLFFFPDQGEIEGTPQTSGRVELQIEAQDNVSQPAFQNFLLSVSGD